MNTIITLLRYLRTLTFLCNKRLVDDLKEIRFSVDGYGKNAAFHAFGTVS